MAGASLARRGWTALIQFGLVLGVLLFLCAGTLRYWQGWAFLATFLVSSAMTTAWFLKYDPDLVERRMHGGAFAEKEVRQKWIQAFVAVLFFALATVPALDWRFGWSSLPWWMAVVGDVLVAAGFVAIFRVLQENSFASAVIEVGEGQQVISTGPYAVVRHPMYAGAMLMIFGAPLALGSIWGLAVSVPLLGVIVWRLLEEERFLLANLSGYDAYRAKVRFRLAPGLF